MKGVVSGCAKSSGKNFGADRYLLVPSFETKGN